MILQKIRRHIARRRKRTRVHLCTKRKPEYYNPTLIFTVMLKLPLKINVHQIILIYVEQENKINAFDFARIRTATPKLSMTHIFKNEYAKINKKNEKANS